MCVCILGGGVVRGLGGDICVGHKAILYGESVIVGTIVGVFKSS